MGEIILPGETIIATVNWKNENAPMRIGLKARLAFQEDKTGAASFVSPYYGVSYADPGETGSIDVIAQRDIPGDWGPGTKVQVRFDVIITDAAGNDLLYLDADAVGLNFNDPPYFQIPEVTAAWITVGDVQLGVQ